MLRRTPLQRKTPLTSRTELKSHSILRRTLLNGSASGGITQRSPLNPVSRKRQQQSRIRKAAEAALGRDGLQGECARCRTWTYVNGHELRRGSWRDHTRPDCLLCVQCNEWAARHPKIACWTGWAISAKWPHDPALENGQALDLYGDIVIFGSAADGAADDEAVAS